MADKKVEVLNIDGILGKPKNRVALIGIELEGGWRQSVGANFGIERDGSVFGGVPVPGHYTGEIALGPMQPAQLTTSIKKYYPHKIDVTCGLHVHMGFDDALYYSMLMVPEYQDTMIEYLKKWAKEVGLPLAHPVWDRLAGNSRFCQKKFWPDDQVRSRKDHDQNRHGHRYTVINYCHSSHGTIECRVLPMMATSELAISAVKRVLAITNACLLVLPARQKHSDRLVMSGADSHDAYIEVAI